MQAITPITSQAAAFVYHMLSVGRCGYDNAYGAQHAGLHDAGDLAALKAMEPLLTVRGGSHQGALYWPLVAVPAALSTPAGDYYRDYQPPEGPHRAQALMLCAIMARAYPVYAGQVWPQAGPRLTAYAQEVGQALEAGGLPAALAASMGIPAPCRTFRPCFCLGLEGGAEAIDITADTHIFGTGRGMDWAVPFVLHEYAIFLLKEALAGTPAFSGHRFWPYTEALAQYYMGLHGIPPAFPLPPEITALYPAPAAGAPARAPRGLFLDALAARDAE